jgi:hypothetical protein
VTLAQVARYADASNFGPSGAMGSAWGLDDVRRKYAALRAHCAALGRPYDSVLRTFCASVILAETAAEVQAKLDTVVGTQPQTEVPAGPGMPREIRTYHNLRVPEKVPLVLVAGSPEEITTYYRALIDAGVQYIIVHGGDTQAVRLMAEHVIPTLRFERAGTHRSLTPAGRLPPYVTNRSLREIGPNSQVTSTSKSRLVTRTSHTTLCSIRRQGGTASCLPSSSDCGFVRACFCQQRSQGSLCIHRYGPRYREVMLGRPLSVVIRAAR